VEVDRNALKFSQFEVTNKPETVVATIDSLLFYDQAGLKLSAWGFNFAAPGERVEFAIPIEATEKYHVKLLAVHGINHGKFKIGFEGSQQISFDAFNDAGDRLLEIDLGKQILAQGMQKFVIQCEGKNADSHGMRIQLVTLNLEPEREFIQEWYVIGPFDNPLGGSDTEGLMIAYPPEKEIDLRKSYQGKDGLNVKWQIIKADEKGFVDLDKYLKPNDSTVAYALTYVWSPDERNTKIFAGSDDGIRIWLNDDLVHHHLVKRGPIPDNDRAGGVLKKGWNTLLIKVEEGEGWWGFYVRIPDPEKRLRFSITKK
jgi:hypothetical protein